MTGTCVGCADLRESQDIGIVWRCLLLKTKIGENTPFLYRPPVPASDTCWHPFEDEEGEAREVTSFPHQRV